MWGETLPLVAGHFSPQPLSKTEIFHPLVHPIIISFFIPTTLQISKTSPLILSHHRETQDQCHKKIQIREYAWSRNQVASTETITEIVSTQQ